MFGPVVGAAQDKPAAPAMVAFGIVADCGTSGASLPKPAPSGPVCLRDTFFLAPGDLRSAEVVPIWPDDSGLKITLVRSAAAKLRRLTRANIERRMALVVNDRVVSMPYIREPISEELMISGPNRSEIDKLLGELRGGGGN